MKSRSIGENLSPVTRREAATACSRGRQPMENGASRIREPRLRRQQTLGLLACLLLIPSVPSPAGEKEAEIRWLPVRDLRVDQVNPTLLMLGRFDPTQGTQETREETRTAIAVRGVFPIQRQRENLNAVTGIGKVMFLDYILERQVLSEDASSNEEPQWEPVNVEVAEDVIRDTAGTDHVLRESSFISPIFTMPLPKRADANWGDNVSHPKLKKQGEYLLFRYLDFDIEPGNYYRYRVRLKVANPWHGLRTKNPFLAAGKTRTPPWSRPSPAILVIDPQ